MDPTGAHIQSFSLQMDHSSPSALPSMVPSSFHLPGLSHPPTWLLAVISHLCLTHPLPCYLSPLFNTWELIGSSLNITNQGKTKNRWRMPKDGNKYHSLGHISRYQQNLQIPYFVPKLYYLLFEQKVSFLLLNLESQTQEFGCLW